MMIPYTRHNTPSPVAKDLDLRWIQTRSLKSCTSLTLMRS